MYPKLGTFALFGIVPSLVDEAALTAEQDVSVFSHVGRSD